jgi:hypothetical protein
VAATATIVDKMAAEGAEGTRAVATPAAEAEDEADIPEGAAIPVEHEPQAVRHSPDSQRNTRFTSAKTRSSSSRTWISRSVIFTSVTGSQSQELRRTEVAAILKPPQSPETRRRNSFEIYFRLTIRGFCISEFEMQKPPMIQPQMEPI